MTIRWIEISKKKYGGIVYNEQAREVLSKNFDLDLIVCKPRYFRKIRYLRIPESFFYLLKLRGKRDLWIRDFYSMITLPLDKTKGKNLVMVHQVSFSGFPLISRPIFFFFKKIFYHNLKKANAIVTVSEYWRNHFLEKGYRNVYKIYNCFNLSNFDISGQEVVELKERFHLKRKPIVYLGNCQRIKGVVEAYQSLKDLDVYLVTSGRPQVKIPAINLNLEYRDYLCLLKSSSLVLTMSKFKEGWCRTAHEAMLLKTPVVGSGLGGMRELLKGGKQIVCQDFKCLKEKVEYLLDHPGTREKMGENGYDFAKNFTFEKFKKEWLNLIKKIV
ncbi:MAG: glycosyltransferase family 4 protein [Minisyncoccales bacterium]